MNNNNIQTISHPFHEHLLVYQDGSRGEFFCRSCLEMSHGPHFHCQVCSSQPFQLHKWCAEQPIEILHPFHPQHELAMRFPMEIYRINKCWVCDECLLPPRGFVYVCVECKFFLHMPCASSTLNRSQSDNRLDKVSFNHACHEKSNLFLYQASKIHEFLYDKEKHCRWCLKPVLADMRMPAYACLLHRIFLHEQCTFKVPLKIQHPFHQAHILNFEKRISTSSSCRACRNGFNHNPMGYYCNKCRWWFHGCCITSLLPSLKSDSHPAHDLTYIENNAQYEWKFACSKCGDCVSDLSGLYGCIECNVNFHLDCILQHVVKHKYHRHSLALMNSSKEDGLDQYYCDICEKERHPNHCVYSCQEECGNFVAHIECALNQERQQLLQLTLKEPSLILQSLEVKSISSITNDNKPVVDERADYGIQINHPNHEHKLSLNDQVRFLYDCKCCHERLFDGDVAFICKSCDNNYWLHKTCAELPPELVQFPLHPPHHRFTLKFESNFSRLACDLCGQVFRGGNGKSCFHYQCQNCKFTLDIKCVVSYLSSPTQYSLSQLIFTKIELHHFSHRHKLHLGNFKVHSKTYCRYCCSQIIGRGYFCPSCELFSLHESCVREIPREIPSLPFHSSSHSFIIMGNASQKYCHGCELSIDDFIGYICVSCFDMKLHSGCALGLRRPLMYGSHSHMLYYIGRDANGELIRVLKSRYHWFECNNCGKCCVGAFYRCLECEINFHVECTIPRVVKSKFHRHPVKLVDSVRVTGHDFEDQYCDVCEEKRDPSHHAYRCEECFDIFVGHVDCVLSQTQMEKIIEKTRQISFNLSHNNLDSKDNTERLTCSLSMQQLFPLEIEEKEIIELGEDGFKKINSIDLHPKKPLILACCEEFVEIWNYKSKELVWKWKKTTVGERISVSKFITWENKSWIILGFYGGHISVYDYEKSEKLVILPSHESSIRCLEVHPSRPYLLSSSSYDGIIKLWEWNNGYWLCTKEFSKHLGGYAITQMAFNPNDPNIFASTSRDFTIMIWNIKIESLDPICAIKDKSDINGIVSINFFMAVHEQLLLSLLYDGTIKIWDYRTLSCVKIIEGAGYPMGPRTRVSAHPELPIIIKCSEDGATEIWNATNYKLEKKLDFDLGMVQLIACRKGSNRFVFGCDRGVAIIKVATTCEGQEIEIEFEIEIKKQRPTM